MILLIDNYDSFVFNLARYFQELGEAVMVRRNDALSVAAVEALAPRAVVLSPGPCTPDEAGICLSLIATTRRPLLGVCLGHQCIGQAFGGRVARTPPVHGRASWVSHHGEGLFEGLPNPLRAGRYHALAVQLPEDHPDLKITARIEDGTIMGLAHRRRPIYGVQFHPESILTDDGHALLRNFLSQAKERGG
ncbi:aminodeoxychorismate/anthranilate synthase component II [Myxococcota bacterium]|nr:aminodeoxychorismate/anthranilate synthase component II [Myxococcota bacterium]MBU1432292.1 aminodeoxychorismate/anthranilate synthase component II [Myxococcota bacterium]MBU1898586.1 aminodeoxychorismate/anthranilate synthase component II [Myxococcota bacterium]